MSEFGPFNNNAYEYNEHKDYNFVITEGNLVVHHLTPVQAYTFLVDTDSILANIVLLSNNEYFISLSPEYGTNRYTDSIWGYVTKLDAYSIFQYIDTVDRRNGGNFQESYKSEFLERKQAGEEVYNPFSENHNNLNWKTVAKLRKKSLKQQLPENFSTQFRKIKANGPYGKWHGATPVSEKNRKTRSRKTRKNRG